MRASQRLEIGLRSSFCPSVFCARVGESTFSLKAAWKVQKRDATITGDGNVSSTNFWQCRIWVGETVLHFRGTYAVYANTCNMTTRDVACSELTHVQN